MLCAHRRCSSLHCTAPHSSGEAVSRMPVAYALLSRSYLCCHCHHQCSMIRDWVIDYLSANGVGSAVALRCVRRSPEVLRCSATEFPNSVPVVGSVVAEAEWWSCSDCWLSRWRPECRTTRLVTDNHNCQIGRAISFSIESTYR